MSKSVLTTSLRSSTTRGTDKHHLQSIALEAIFSDRLGASPGLEPASHKIAPVGLERGRSISFFLENIETNPDFCAMLFQSRSDRDVN